MKKIIFILFIFQSLYAEHKFTNDLINEDSLYLRQHAHNPVEWYPWGNEALERAKRENKLIFLSIGYSTCHWCHVMEEESFEDEGIAMLLNESYISIKIDREELPQIDKKYQKLYLDVNGKRGGWPLNVFLTPDLEPLHIAIYIPATRGYGSIGMSEMLPNFANRYEKKPEEIAKLVTVYKNAKQINKSLDKNLTMGIVSKVLTDIEHSFDKEYGGFDTRPKFPEASKIELLLNIYKLNGNKKALNMAETTLRSMAEGGIYDHVEGGFFRYTTDQRWHIPHFEKMLYTNAELIPQYVTMYKLTKNPLYKKVVTETIAHMEKYFMIDGHYLSASDADSDGVEGGYFIYSYEEVVDTLVERMFSQKEAHEALTYLGIEEDGNIDGEYSNAHISADIVPPRLNEVKEYLLSLRKKRKYPFRDKKIITAWNAMMIKALYAASKIDSDYIGLANKRLKNLEKLMKRDSKLYHQITLGREPKQLGLLEDYAFLIDAYLEGYFRTYDKYYLKEAESLSMEAIEIFYRGKIWYLSADDIDTVADFDDRYYTSALSVMLENLVRVGSLIGDMKYQHIVRDTIASHGAILESSPSSAPKLTQIFLRLQLGDVIIKSNLKNLNSIQSNLSTIKYPFILTKLSKDSTYLVCKINSCFAYAKVFDELVDDIEKSKLEIDDKKRNIWK